MVVSPKREYLLEAKKILDKDEEDNVKYVLAGKVVYQDRILRHIAKNEMVLVEVSSRWWNNTPSIALHVFEKN